MNVWVTGGSRGIGAETVRLFTQRGWSARFLYKSADACARALEKATGARGVACDVADADAVARAFGDARVDALIVNAGVSAFGLLQEMTQADWRRVMDVNLDGAFHAVKAALPGMISRKAGSVVFVSSMWGLTGASCEAAYSASKAALIGLTKALCKEVGPSGIRVNCVCPGVIDTDMNARLTDADRAALSENTPLGRMGRAEEVARAIYFLCGEDASFVTGQILGVDGGFAV